MVNIAQSRGKNQGFSCEDGGRTGKNKRP